MNALAIQVRQQFVAIEIPVTDLALSFVVHRRRLRERERAGRPPATVAIAWFQRLLRQTGWRYIVAGDFRLELDETFGDLFVRNRARLIVRLRVMFPPAEPLGGVEYMNVPTDLLSIPLGMPSVRRPR